MGQGGKRNIYLGALAIAFLSVSGFFIFTHLAAAQTAFVPEDIGGTLGLTTVDLKTLVINILKWVLGIVSLVVVSYLIYGGILWLTSAGNEEKIKKAKKTIFNAIIGLIIVLLAWAIVLLVNHFITNVTNGGGTACKNNEISPDGCRICVAGIWNYIPGACALPGSEFYTKDVGTDHEGTENDKKVYMCSRIQPLFNNVLDETTVPTAVADGTNPLQIIKSGDGKQEGTWETTGTFGKTITYKHPKQCSTDANNKCGDQTAINACTAGGGTCDPVLFEANTNYEVDLPNILKDKDTLALQWSTNSPLYCTNASDHVVCSFTTSDKNDTEKPSIVNTYPANTGSPDINVARQPSIDVNFSENIDATTVVNGNSAPQPNANNIVLEQLTGRNGTVVSTVNANILQVEMKDAGFRLSLTGANALESYTWYKVTVRNIEDLCGNPMANPLSWEFETNDKVAGIESVYPTGQNECPGVKIAVVFNTTMFDNIVSLSVNGNQLIMSAPASFAGNNPDYSVTTAFGTLRILDPEAGNPLTLNPDDKFRVYEITSAQPLAINTTYNIILTTDRVIDSSGGTLHKDDWSFAVTTAEACTCAPQIYNLEPASGGRGQCVTIHGQCFKGTANHAANPTQVLFGATDAGIRGSGNDYIVTTSPDTFSAGDHPPVTVKIDYGAPYGELTSNAVNYVYQTSDESNGPCLFAVNTAGGGCYPLTPATLEGMRFGATSQATKVVTFANGALPATVGNWSDTQIQSRVPQTNLTIGGPVYVTNSVGRSNGVNFGICQPLPGVPVVTQYWPTCDAACVNAVAGAIFSEKMNAATMTPANVRIETCTDSTCDRLVASLTIGVLYDEISKTLSIFPSSNLERGTWYKVTLTDGIKSEKDVSIGNPNEGNNFVWKFKTKDDVSLCVIDRADVSPATYTAKVSQTINFNAYAYGSPDSCNAATGQMLNSLSYNWGWLSSNSAQATVTSNTADGRVLPYQTVSALAVTPNVRISAAADGKSDYGDLTITEDPTYCVTNADCSTNELGESCPGSTCVNNRCTPVFLAAPNEFNPADGAVGTWVAAAGCWFGNYVPGKSKLLFFNNQEGIIPNTNICGTGTWTNTRILREVPGAAATGPITINRDDDRTVTTTVDYYVNTVVRPGICSINPDVGREGVTEVQIRGKNFGASRGSSRVTFFSNADAIYSPNIWSDDNIRVVVPIGARTGDLKVTVTVDSNGWPFTVLPASCTTLCTNDAECFITPNQGCDSDGCCSDRPTISSSIPANGDNNVCLNTAIRINFSQPMDTSTLNAGSILLASGPLGWTSTASPGTNIPLAGKLRVESQAVTISLGVLLQGNTEYRISLHDTLIKNSKGVSLGIPGRIIFRTADTTSPCEIARVAIFPSYHTFLTPLSTKPFEALAYDNKDQQINRITNVYDWTYTWSSDDPSIVTFPAPLPYPNEDIIFGQPAAPVKEGQTYLKVVTGSPVGWTGTKEASSQVRVINCDLGWQYSDAAGNCDPGVGGAGCNDYHFSLLYCRGKYGQCEGSSVICSADNSGACPAWEVCCPNPSQKCIGQKPLPYFDLSDKAVERGQTGEVLKQFLFKESDATKKDAVGVRIFANSEMLSPTAWYENNIKIKGSPQTTIVDGYEAIRDGRTVYVAAPNLQGGTLYNNIYLISYNDDAAASTVDIFNQMVSNWFFNTNMNAADKPLLARDIKRVSDLRTIISYLDDYRINHQEERGSNLIQNGGFESSSTNYINWSPSAAGNKEVVSNQKKVGNNSLRLSTGGVYVFQNFNLEFGKTYEVSGYVKTNLDSAHSALMLGQCIRTSNGENLFHDPPDGCGLDFDSTAVTGVSGWTRVSHIITSLKADRHLRIALYMSDGATGEVWWDEISLKEISAPYPALQAGSYLKNMTFSRWPSWQATLGNDLQKTLPQDPKQSLLCKASSPSTTDKNTCWDEPSKTFTCDINNTYLYAYKTNQGANYELYAQLEYKGQGAFLRNPIPTYNLCVSPSDCACFNYQITGP